MSHIFYIYIVNANTYYSIPYVYLYGICIIREACVCTYYYWHKVFMPLIFVPHFDTYLDIIFKSIAVLSAQFIIFSSTRSLTNRVEAGGSHDGIPEANK